MIASSEAAVEMSAPQVAERPAQRMAGLPPRVLGLATLLVFWCGYQRSQPVVNTGSLYH
jgi:hypothetical protein